MNLWQKIKSFSFQKKSFLERYDSYSLLERFVTHLRRGNTRTTASNSAEAYAYHELVFSCVNKIADVMNDAEIIVERQNKDGEWEPDQGHPLTNLLNMPNQAEVGEDFRRKLVISEQAAGIVYIFLNRSKAGLPVEMVVLNPFRIRQVPTSDRSDIAYYEYTKINGKTSRIELDDMLVRRRPDLFNQASGASPVMVALKAINSDMGLTDYVDAFFENDATPTGVLRLLNRAAGQTEKEKIQEAWKNKYGNGGSHQKGLAVIDKNADYQQIGSKLDDLDSESVSSRLETRICSPFGVPPILVGAFVGLRWSNQRASAKHALQDFWINKVHPDLKQFRKWLTMFLLPEFEEMADIQAGKVRVGFDVSQTGFLQEEVNDIHDRARKNFVADIYTKNEARELVGLKPVDGGDIFRSEVAAEMFQARQLSSGGDDPKVLPPVKKKIKQKYWRDLSEVEKRINLKKIEDDLEKSGENITKLFLEIRSKLIKQASDQAESPTHLISLTIPKKYEKQAVKLFGEAFRLGREQVIDELNSQKSGRKFELKERDYDLIDFVGIVFRRIVSEVTARATNIITLLYAEDDFDQSEMEQRLRDESQKSFEQLARNSANLAMQAGREQELEENEVSVYEYSAILDKNTCSPCKRWDGEQSENLNDLPKCPNKECAGNWNCRCFIVGIAD